MERPGRGPAFLCQVIECFDFFFGKKEPTRLFRAFGKLGLKLARDDTVRITFLKNILHYRGQVFRLGLAKSKGTGGESIRMNHLEIKVGGVLVPIIQMIAAQGGGGATNQCPHQFVEQSESVSFVCPEWL